MDGSMPFSCVYYTPISNHYVPLHFTAASYMRVWKQKYFLLRTDSLFLVSSLFNLLAQLIYTLFRVIWQRNDAYLTPATNHWYAQMFVLNFCKDSRYYIFHKAQSCLLFPAYWTQWWLVLIPWATTLHTLTWEIQKNLCSSKLQLFAGYANSFCWHFLQGLIVRDWRHEDVGSCRENSTNTLKVTVMSIPAKPNCHEKNDLSHNLECQSLKAQRLSFLWSPLSV